jgi:arginine decarboxylase
VTLGATESKVLRLIQALQQLAKKTASRTIGKPAPLIPLPPFGEITQLPHSAYFGPTVDLPLTGESHGINPDIIGSVCAVEIVPYPPGIPLLVPGQLISEAAADYLMKLIHSQSDNEIHGLIFRADEPFLRVVN